MNNQEMQVKFQNALAEEFSKVIITWDPTLREWHKWATYCLKYHDPLGLNWPPGRFSDLYESTDEGVKLDVIAVLCFSINKTGEYTSELDHATYMSMLQTNTIVAKRWEKIANPIVDTVRKRFQLMSNIPLNVPKNIGQA